MNNEEKILSLLEKMASDIVELKATQVQQGEQLTKQGEQLAKQGERMDRMEERLDELDARSLRSAVILETNVARDIRLVYEGQEMLRQKLDALAPKDRVDALESDVAIMKDVIKLMRMEINDLKQAK